MYVLFICFRLKCHRFTTAMHLRCSAPHALTSPCFPVIASPPGPLLLDEYVEYRKAQQKAAGK